MRRLERYAAAALIAAIGVGWEATMGAAGARDSGNCPTAERAQIPEHLQSLKATATTVEGTGGITVDFVAHPLPPHRGKPWSHWGEGLVASNGRYYTAIGDSLGRDGNSYLYEYDPASKTLRAVGDVLTAYGKHREGDWGYGKVHGQISEGPCGHLYFHTYWGSHRKLEYRGSYTGDLLMRYDPVAQQLVSLGVPMPETGTPSTQMWGGLFYGEANHPKSDSWPDGKIFWAYDIARDKVVFTSPDLIDHNSGRDIAVDGDGRAYYSGAGDDLLRYDPAANAEERIGAFPHPGKLRASSEPAPDGKIFMTTNKGDDYYAYLFDPESAVAQRAWRASRRYGRPRHLGERRGRILHPGRARRRPGTLLPADGDRPLRQHPHHRRARAAYRGRGGPLPCRHVLVQCRSAQSRRHLRPRQRRSTRLRRRLRAADDDRDSLARVGAAMKTRAVAILLAGVAFAGAGVDSSGERVVRLAAGADRPSAAADLGHPEKDTVIAFEDVTPQSGLDSLLDCMMGHSAAVGDVDADGLPDLFFGTFSNRRPESLPVRGGRPAGPSAAQRRGRHMDPCTRARAGAVRPLERSGVRRPRQ